MTTRSTSRGSARSNVLIAEQSRPAIPITIPIEEATDREQAIETLCLSAGDAIEDSTMVLDRSLTTPVKIAGTFRTDLLPRPESTGSASATPSISDPVLLAMEVLGARLRKQDKPSRSTCDLCGGKASMLYGRPGLKVTSVRYGDKSYPRLSDDRGTWIAYCPECRQDLELMRKRRLNPQAYAPTPPRQSRHPRR